VNGETGVLFDELTVESLSGALDRVAGLRVETARVRAHAEQFSRERHIEQMRQTIAETIAAPAGSRW
jgi:hypothetical protein